MAVGAYRPGDSLYHRLDPRTKVIVVGCLALVCCLPHDGASWIGLTGLVLLQAYLSGSSRQTLLMVVAGTLPVAALSLSLQALMTPGTAVWPSLPALTWEGLEKGGELGLRFILLACLCQYFVYTTSPFRLCRAFEWFLAPLGWLGLPIRDLALVAGLSLKFVPVLSYEANRLMQAQSARGAYIDHGPWHKRLSGMLSILVPLLVRVFRYSDELSIAMEARGYSSRGPRTELYPLRFTALDMNALALLSVALVCWLTYPMALVR